MFQALFQLFFPHRCVACSGSLHWHEKVICFVCENNLPFTDFFEVENNRVEQTFLGRIDVKAASLLYFESELVKPMMHALKYQNRIQVAILFGEWIANGIQKSKRFPRIDVVVPVPLHPKKEKLRGFNQSWTMAKRIAEKLNTASDKDLLVRKEFTSTQTKKNRIERWQNVATVFDVKNNKVIKGKTILLVDDVVTTGATAEACLQILKQHEAEQLFFVTAATV